jgi:hypothetical protein
MYGGNFSSLATPILVPSTAQVAPSVLFGKPTDTTGCKGVVPAGIVQGQPFPGNIIPSCMISPNAAALLNAGIFPAPNATDPGGNPEFKGGANSPTNLKEEIVRVDHNFSPKFSVFGHFVAEQVTQGFGISQWSGDKVPTVGDTFGNPSFSGVIHTTYAISPTLLNEAAFNYNGNRINIIPYAATGLKSLALPSGYNSANTRLFSGPNNLSRIPNIDLSGNDPNFEISSWPWKNKADDYQIRDDISLTKGSHQLKFGASWAIYKKIQDLFGQTQGGFSFDGTFTGNDVADLVLGTAKGYQELAVQDSGKWNNVSWAAYAQDNWRVNHRLTLNLGLRWDGVPHTYEANDRMGNFYPSLYSTANKATFNTNNTICSAASTGLPGDPNPGCTAASPGLGSSPNSIITQKLYLNGIGIPGQNGVPKGLVNNHWAAFGPRLGFAYDLTGAGKTVVRGGFGIMYERIQGNDMYNAGPNIPFSLQVNSNSVEMANPNLALANGNPVIRPINPAGLTTLDINGYKLPVSYQYSAGVQRQFGPKSVLSVSYVGNQGRHQNDYRNINLPGCGLGSGCNSNSDQSYLANLVAGANYNVAPGLSYPGFNSVKAAENEANTHYNAMQVDFNSQIGRDLNLRAFYTLSRTIDPGTGSNGGQDLQTVSNPYAGWKYDVGPGGYDRTHVAVADFIYDIPLFRHNDSKLLKSTVGGWQVSGIATFESGLPINVTVGGGQNGNGVGGNNRPNAPSSISYPHTVAHWFDPTAFASADPASGAWGTLGHNALRGPSRQNWNISLFKSFTLSESRGSRLELRLETFNTWNHPQFNNVSTSVSYTAAGVMKPSNFGQVTSAFDPRILQLGAKIYF